MLYFKRKCVSVSVLTFSFSLFLLLNIFNPNQSSKVKNKTTTTTIKMIPPLRQQHQQQELYVLDQILEFRKINYSTQRFSTIFFEISNNTREYRIFFFLQFLSWSCNRNRGSQWDDGSYAIELKFWPFTADR